MTIGLDREIENAVWDLGPEKFARRGHQRCTNPGSLTATGIAYVYMGPAVTGTGIFDQTAMQLCSCVVARVTRHGLTPIRRAK